MSEFLQNFHFLRPWVLILTVIPVAAYWRWHNHINAASSWEKVCDRQLLDFLLIKGSSAQRRIVFYLCALGFAVSIMAAAGPCWKKKEAEGLSAENPIMIVLNLSSDMAEQDVKPNRLARAGYAVADLLAGVTQGQKGLIVYAGEPFLISPMTEDGKIISNLLPGIDFSIMPENGDRLDLALRLAAEKMHSNGMLHGTIVVVAAEVGQEFMRAVRAAENVAASGYIIDVISVNSRQNDKLQKIAELGGGIYVNAGQTDKLSQEINRRTAEELQKSQNKISQWLDYGWYLIFVPLLSCLYMFRKGILSIVMLFAWSMPAQAGFFLNADQEGLQAFRNADYQAASAAFTDKNWQGASFYRLQNYEKAYEHFAVSNDETSLYNQGNALAKMGRIEEAVKKYEQVLEKNPDHEDAKFNLEYLKQQQGAQQSSPQSDDEGQDEQQQNEQQGATPQNSSNQPDDSQSQKGDSENQQNERSAQSQPDSRNNTEQQPNENNQAASAEQLQASEEQNEPKEQQENKGNALQDNTGEDVYDEDVQARELQYREIPEDAGGLLRAFIAREYAKNRYVKDK